jgi:hypothetical protein
MSWPKRCMLAVIAVLFVFFVARARWTSQGASATGQTAQQQSTPREEGPRAREIHETLEVIRAECQRHAGGDWDRWSNELGPVRTDLLKKIRAVKAYRPEAAGYFVARSPVLEGRDHFPLFEPAPEHYLRHVVEPASLDAFRTERPVVAASRWLKARGIDVIFVPVPKMTEIYPEYFTDHCPPDRIIAPRVRQTMLELLEADVEVVDLWYAFQAERDQSDELLYQPADPHWGPRAQAIAARLIAERLKRYEFVVKAQAAKPIWQGPDLPFPAASEGAAFKALNPDQQKRAIEHQPRSSRIPAKYLRPQFDDSAPVACIGDSYNGGFMELLGRELNLPMRPLAGGGNTTDAFKNFLRDPDVLKDCKVVIWLVCTSSLKNPWPVPQKIHETFVSAARN